jgi:hypothetical protein
VLTGDRPVTRPPYSDNLVRISFFLTKVISVCSHRLDTRTGRERCRVPYLLNPSDRQTVSATGEADSLEELFSKLAHFEAAMWAVDYPPTDLEHGCRLNLKTFQTVPGSTFMIPKGYTEPAQGAD